MMAMISGFMKNITATRGRHPTTVACGWSVNHDDAGAFITLSTYGSVTRKKVGGVSQTIQLDRRAASQLVLILKDAFPGV